MMEALYSDAIVWMRLQLSVLEGRVPRPKATVVDGHVAYRHVEKTVHQAIIQKLARMTSGLQASSLLLNAGFLQESAALARMVDEYEKDLTFLALASTEQPAPNILQNYLAAFFAEEQSHVSFRQGQRVKGRPLVSRKDIANHIASKTVGDPFTSSNTSLALSNTFSGYVHAASPHIMEMYDPTKISFEVGPTPDHPLLAHYHHNQWNYYYRGILAFGFASYAFDEPRVREAVNKFKPEFEHRSGDCVDF
jgi:hypothetical protein